MKHKNSVTPSIIRNDEKDINDSIAITNTFNNFFTSVVPLLFLIFINDINIAIKHSKTFHFADDTCLLNIKDSVKEVNKVVNKGLKFLVQWLNANIISLNVAKTEVVIFRRKKRQIDCDLNLKLCGKKNLKHQMM